MARNRDAQVMKVKQDFELALSLDALDACTENLSVFIDHATRRLIVNVTAWVMGDVIETTETEEMTQYRLEVFPEWRPINMLAGMEHYPMIFTEPKETEDDSDK